MRSLQSLFFAFFKKIFEILQVKPPKFLYTEMKDKEIPFRRAFEK